MKKSPFEWCKLVGISPLGLNTYDKISPITLSDFWCIAVQSLFWRGIWRIQELRIVVFKNLPEVDKQRAGLDRFFCEQPSCIR